jgi:hypothetical protein
MSSKSAKTSKVSNTYASTKVEWKDKTPAQKERDLKRKNEKEAKKRAAAGEWSKEEDTGTEVVQRIPWFNWADEV